MARKRVESKPKNSGSIRPVIFIIAGVILVIAAVLLFINQSNPTKSSTITDVAQVQRITLENARKALTENSAVFLDVRSADSFKVNHISGAINIPLDELENRYTELDPNQWIITYCT